VLEYYTGPTVFNLHTSLTSLLSVGTTLYCVTRCWLVGESLAAQDVAQACGNIGQKGKCQPEEVASLQMRKGLWNKYASQQYPALAKMVVRLLCLHATSATTERNWSFWGRVYTSARNALGIDRAKRLVTFLFNDLAGVQQQNDSALLLSVIEGERASEGAPQAVDM
jgi:hypothetical protein